MCSCHDQICIYQYFFTFLFLANCTIKSISFSLKNGKIRTKQRQADVCIVVGNNDDYTLTNARGRRKKDIKTNHHSVICGVHFRFACNISMSNVCDGAEPAQCLMYRCSSPRVAIIWISGIILSNLANLSYNIDNF